MEDKERKKKEKKAQKLKAETRKQQIVLKTLDSIKENPQLFWGMTLTAILTASTLTNVVEDAVRKVESEQTTGTPTPPKALSLWDVMPILWLSPVGWATKGTTDRPLYKPPGYIENESPLWNVAHGLYGVAASVALMGFIYSLLYPKGSTGPQGSGSILALAAIAGLSAAGGAILTDIGKES